MPSYAGPFDRYQKEDISIQEDQDFSCNPICTEQTNLQNSNGLNNPANTLNNFVQAPWVTPYKTKDLQSASGGLPGSTSWNEKLPNAQNNIRQQVAQNLGQINQRLQNLTSLPEAVRDNAIEQIRNDVVSIGQTIQNFSLNIDDFQSVSFLPLHLLLSWGAGARDLDIHLTGPNGDGTRFHVFYRNLGDLDGPPGAKIIDDCISTNCSEVLKIETLNDGGVYRASVHNFGDQSANSTNLSSQSDVQLQLIRGGAFTPSEGDTDVGSTIIGGDVLFSGSPTSGEQGNTWQAIEIDPAANSIDFINTITNVNRPDDIQ